MACRYSIGEIESERKGFRRRAGNVRSSKKKEVGEVKTEKRLAFASGIALTLSAVFQQLPGMATMEIYEKGFLFMLVFLCVNELLKQ